jgi:molecular chaperone DnaK
MEEAQQLNDADTMLYTAEKTKTDLTGKISEADVGKIDTAARDLRKAIESKDFGAVKSKADALRKVRQDIGSSVYQQSAEQGQAPEQPRTGGASPEGSQGPQSDGKVTDADYKVVEDEKK